MGTRRVLFTHSSLTVDLRGSRVARPNTVQGNQANLIALVELVIVTLVEDELQKRCVHIDVHGFQLSGLEV